MATALELSLPPRAAVTVPLLTVIVPVFNEERTIDLVLRRLRDGPYPDKEVIVVDDGSTDATPQILQAWAGQPGFLILRHHHNQGKGAAIRTGLAQARGEIAIIQDADLEYDPADFPRLIEPIRRGESDVVYGSRYLRPGAALPTTRFRLAVSCLNFLVRLLYGQRLTDEATCYKAFRTSLLRRLNLQATGFEFCPEVTAKVCRLGYAIIEVPISYRPRTTAEGKKIGWRDGFRAVWTLLRYRLSARPARGAREDAMLCRTTWPANRLGTEETSLESRL
jgi:glycosyltransferase involved in cell wall biosynthesis